jgi:hypothetical protein
MPRSLRSVSGRSWTVEVVGDRGRKLHVSRAAKHHFTLIRIVARRRTKRRDEYQPHVASVLGIGAGLEDASIHHDDLASLDPSGGERLVEQQAAPGPPLACAELHVGRADDDKLAPTPGNADQKTDGSGRVRLTAHDLAVEDDDASPIEPLDPDYVLERKPMIPRT